MFYTRYLKVLFFPQLPVSLTPATMDIALKPSTATTVLVLKACMETGVRKVREYNDVLVSSLHYFKDLISKCFFDFFVGSCEV